MSRQKVLTTSNRLTTCLMIGQGVLILPYLYQDKSTSLRSVCHQSLDIVTNFHWNSIHKPVRGYEI